ncbi:PepSY-associated TM helix domain-containing protein [Pigmentiphaga soli]|uniref:PepSY-associated TM helix domain-containing protein n=1 Tax=Pigmentiphaga soli TaxID=1007095 RepID=A0ABP8GLC0_9BURK
MGAAAPVRGRPVSTTALRRWRALHTWSSLWCTALLLILCATGLPLIFADEIEALQADGPPRTARAAGEPLADIDGMVAAARARHPGEAVRFVFIDDDEAAVKVVMAPADVPDRSRDHEAVFDARSAALLADEPPAGRQPMTFMAAARRLHTDLFAGQRGQWVLAATGLAFLMSLASGVALYGPFTRGLGFGTVRRRSPRTRWLDLHNLVGICVLAWMTLIGATGILNAISLPLSAWWRAGEMSVLLGGTRGRPVEAAPASADAAYRAVGRALPDRNVTSIIFPSASFSNPRHYLIWSNGNSPLTSRLFTAALVDARSGELAAVAQMPAYLRLAQLSRPLHFGDFGGMPLKLVWAALDTATIAVLASGLYLWAARRRAARTRLSRAA